jgi:hypothetical protein
LSVPQGAVAQPGEGPVAVRLTSINGWVITVQTGKFNPTLDLSGMVSRLEERFLGPNRAWNAKLGQRPGGLGGLPGIELAYSGERSRWQVLIARGRLTDFVVFVSAQPDTFTDRGEEIRSVLSSFNPRPEEKPDAPAASVAPMPANPALPPAVIKAPEKVPPAAAPASLPEKASLPDKAPPPEKTPLSVRAPTPGPASPPSPAPVDASAVAPPAKSSVAAAPALAKQFDDPSLGFAVGYPAEWVEERGTDYTVVFAGPPGSEAYYATVAIQNVGPPAAADPVSAANTAFDESRKQIAAAATELTTLWERPYAYDHGGVRLLGREFLVSYRWQDQRFSKWVVVLPNPAHPIAHIFSYTAPEASFPAYRPNAEAMLQSWIIHGTEKDATGH